MKKFLLFIIILVTTLVLNAAETSTKSNSNKQDSSKIVLYAEDNTQKIIETLPLSTHLIKIYQKGDWIKVGNPADGTVGWVNQKQYQEAIDSLNKPSVQQIFISQTQDKSNKPQMKIVVYQNGKRVSEKEAKEMYDNVRLQLQEQQQYFNAWRQNISYNQKQIWADFLQDPFFAQ